ncbi:MAG: DNA-binding response regulator [Candidatus Cloacimonadota bacterium]|nr:MAG: DNA-binding response regulator [Candidatus Cloacimonadota bacterium]
MKVLIIDDETRQGLPLQKLLKKEGYVTEYCSDPNEGLYQLKEISYDLLLLDLNMPKLDGFELLNQLRNLNINTPVIIISSRCGFNDKINGLNIGADDYLTKPYKFEELLARVKALLRRSKKQINSSIKVDDLIVDISKRSVTRNQKSINLTTREYNLLELFVLNIGKILTRQEILDNICDINYDKDNNIVDVYIAYLRKKVDKGSANKLIHTKRGAGYYLDIIS